MLSQYSPFPAVGDLGESARTFEQSTASKKPLAPGHQFVATAVCVSARQLLPQLELRSMIPVVIWFSRYYALCNCPEQELTVSRGSRHAEAVELRSRGTRSAGCG